MRASLSGIELSIGGAVLAGIPTGTTPDLMGG